MADQRSVLIEFRGDANSFVAAVKEMTSQMQKFTQQLAKVDLEQKNAVKSTEKLETSQKSLGVASIAAGNLLAMAAQRGIQWLTGMANTFKDTAVETYKLQLALGGSAEQMSALRAALNAYKVPFDALIVSYGTFAQQVVTGTKAAKAFHIEQRDGAGNIKSAVDLIKEAADKINALGSVTDRTAAARELFGRRYKELLPILAQGGQGIDDLMRKMKAMGLTLDEAGVKKGLEFQRTQTNMKQAMQGLSLTISQSVIPAVTNLLLGVSGMIQGFSNFVKEHKWVVQAFMMVAGAITAVVVGQKLMNNWIPAIIGGIKALIPELIAFSDALFGVAEAEAAAESFSVAGIFAAIGAGGAFLGIKHMLDSASKEARKNLPKDVPPDTTGTQDFPVPGGTSASQSKKNAAVDRAKKHLQAVKDFWDAQVTAAKDALEATKKAAEAYQNTVKQISEAISKTAEVPSLIEESFAKYMGPSSLIKAFQQKITDAKNFLSALTQLRDAGLDPTILGQLAAAGPQAGLDAARVILSDVSSIMQLNDLQAQLTDIAGTTATMAGQYTQAESYAAFQGIGAAQGALTAAQASQAAAVAAAQKQLTQVNNINVSASTNASPKNIADTVAFGISAGSFRQQMEAFEAAHPVAPGTKSNELATQAYNVAQFNAATQGQFKTTPYGM